MASVMCRPDNPEGLLHFHALVVAIVKCIMGMSLGDESSDSSQDDVHGFEFRRPSA